MSYATRADMAASFGAREVADLERGEAERIERALADAAAEIDAELATVYVVPLVAWMSPGTGAEGVSPGRARKACRPERTPRRTRRRPGPC